MPEVTLQSDIFIKWGCSMWYPHGECISYLLPCNNITANLYFNTIHTSFYFYFWLCHMTCGIVVPQPVPIPLHWKLQVLTTGLSGYSQHTLTVLKFLWTILLLRHGLTSSSVSDSYKVAIKMLSRAAVSSEPQLGKGSTIKLMWLLAEFNFLQVAKLQAYFFCCLLAWSYPHFIAACFPAWRSSQNGSLLLQSQQVREKKRGSPVVGSKSQFQCILMKRGIT